jgi:hypothetical protein
MLMLGNFGAQSYDALKVKLIRVGHAQVEIPSMQQIARLASVLSENASRNWK